MTEPRITATPRSQTSTSALHINSVRSGDPEPVLYFWLSPKVCKNPRPRFAPSGYCRKATQSPAELTRFARSNSPRLDRLRVSRQLSPGELSKGCRAHSDLNLYRVLMGAGSVLGWRGLFEPQQRRVPQPSCQRLKSTRLQNVGPRPFGIFWAMPKDTGRTPAKGRIRIWDKEYKRRYV